MSSSNSPRVETGLEEGDQQPGDVDVALERVLDVVVRERRAPLSHVLRDRPQQRRLAPGQADGKDEAVEAVRLVLPLPDRGDGVLEELPTALGQRPGVPQTEVVEVGHPRQPLQLVGPLVDDLDAHRGQHRQHPAQREDLTDPVDLQPGVEGVGIRFVVVRQGHTLVAFHRLETGHVEGPGQRVVVLLVGLGECVGVLADQLHPPAPRRSSPGRP